MINHAFCPDAVALVRMDHTHVFALFHRYRIDADPVAKRGLVELIAQALEIHAALEEEIFYPAVMAVDDNETTRKSVPEHDTMRSVIRELRTMDSSLDAFDERFMDLMNEVLHHVADEETDMLLLAERSLSSRRLRQLGARMLQRRVGLMMRRAPALSRAFAQGFPSATAVVCAALAGRLFYHALRGR